MPIRRPRNPLRFRFRFRWLNALVLAVSIPIEGLAASAAETAEFPTAEELRALSIEELADLRITTVALRPERVRVTPAAVSVVTADDIRRSGATNLPDALRLATGVHVAHSNNNTWAIGVRGFNSATNNKLLVLQDGRSLYSPLFSGVFWDVQDTLIEDIERIEVIRGPGATMWGANAVNGVINIITRNAKETQGALVAAGAGNSERGFASARFGAQVGEHTWYRVYARGWEREDIVAADGSDTGERRRFGQGGFRLDSEPAPEIAWTLQGDLYDGRFDRQNLDPIDVFGGNLLARWTHSFEEDRHVNVQTYYDRVKRDIPGLLSERRDTFDAQFQHRFPAGDRHDFLWGAGGRLSRDNVEASPTLAFSPENRDIRILSGFIQDRISLMPDLLELTLGSKLEHSTYVGFDYQPSGRLAWMPTDRQTVWGSVSRATRAPSRIDTDALFFPGTPGEIQGNPGFESERMLAYELGYRIQPATPVTFDFAFFYNDYDRLRSVEGEDPAVLDNLLEGETYGGEVSINYQVSEWWRVRTGYAHLQKRLRAKEESDDDPDVRGAEGNDPRHIVFFHSRMDLGERWRLDGVVRHVSALPNPRVPAYTELDLRAAYRVDDHLEFSLVGRNLAESHHREFGTTRAVPRSVFFQVKWEQ